LPTAFLRRALVKSSSKGENMNSDRFQEMHRDITDEARALCRHKQNDYASEKDIFANFRLCDQLGLCSPESGILVRMSDKLARLSNVIGPRPASVQNESIRDTIIDLVNYSILLYSIVCSEREDHGE